MKNKSFLFITVMVLAVSFLFSAFTADFASAEGEVPIGTAVCTAKGALNLRSGPGTSYKKTGSLPRNTTVNVYAKSGSWYKIKYEDAFHWASSSYLEFIPIDNEAIGTARCTANTSMNLRSGPGTSYDKVGKLPGGTSVNIYAVNGGWYQVYYDGQYCWASGQYLDVNLNGGSAPITTPTPDIPTPSNTPITTPLPTPSRTGSLGRTAIGEAKCLANLWMNLRKGPGTSYDKAGKLPGGETVQIYSVKDGWYEIYYDSQFCWASGDYLDVRMYAGTATPMPTAPTAPPEPTVPLLTPTPDIPELTPSPSPSEYETEAPSPSATDTATEIPSPTASESEAERPIGEAVCTANIAMNLRSGPGTSYSLTDTLPGGTKVSIYGKNGDWYKIKYNGGYHWAYGSYLDVKLNQPEESNYTVIALGTTTGSVNIRSGHGTDTSKLDNFAKGSLVEIYEVNSYKDWHKINYDGTVAYVSGQYVSVSMGTGKILAFGKMTSDSTMRRGAGSDFDSLGSIKTGKTINIMDFSPAENWYLIEYNDRYGYIAKSAVEITEYTENMTIYLDKRSASLDSGESLTLKAVAASDAEISWSTDNSNVAVVSESGTVTAKGPGSAVITATTQSGYSASCTVKVSSDSSAPYDDIIVKGNVYQLYTKLDSPSEEAIEAYIKTLDSSKLRDRLVLTALHYAGMPYASADCSMITRNVYSTEGVSLPRTSADQAKNLANYKIDVSKVKPGDLVFFKNYDGESCSCGSKCTRYLKIHHVALYIGKIAGEHYFVEASSVINKCVIRRWDGTYDHAEMTIVMAASRF